MFYFFLPSLFSFNTILVAAAVVPAALLLMRVYRSDKLEAESYALLWKLVTAGVLSSLLALVEEWILSALLKLALPQDSVLYSIILYFGVVALAEESSKYLFLKRRTWRSAEFNCQYDAVVYALFVSLGFALWENISYVMAYGFGTAIVRALTAIPGHACFGVFMGIFYGIAKRLDNRGENSAAKGYRILSVLVPAALHGAYDYIASTDAPLLAFVGFIAALFIVSYLLVGRFARDDRYI